ncbi:MAG: hypothetical protein HY000_17055 [Planctomycetes bacterium]|nr:hypothetical protein [Planctomycetota bacterium]
MAADAGLSRPGAGDPRRCQRRPALLRALEDPEPQVRVYAIKALSLLGQLDETVVPVAAILEEDRSASVRIGLAWNLERDNGPQTAAAIREALRGYGVSAMDTARVDEPAPDFSLVDSYRKAYHLWRFRGKGPLSSSFSASRSDRKRP